MAVKIETREFDQRFSVGYVESIDDGWRELIAVWKDLGRSKPHAQLPSLKALIPDELEMIADACYVASELLGSLQNGQLTDE